SADSLNYPQIGLTGLLLILSTVRKLQYIPYWLLASYLHQHRYTPLALPHFIDTQLARTMNQ
ncbi:unnamed protein product, partial (mitochondrion) [Musa banksii]